MFSDVRGAIVRRWYVLAIALCLTAGLCVAVTRVVPLEYETRALTVLLPPKALLSTGGNPYLGLGGLDSAASVLSKSMYGQDVSQLVTQASPTAEYEVEPDASTSGPVLLTIVKDRSPQSSLDALQVLLKALPEQLQALQLDSNAPPKYLITVTVVTQDTKATTLFKNQIRAVIAAGGAGAASSLMLVALLDGILMRRRARGSSDEPKLGWPASSSEPLRDPIPVDLDPADSPDSSTGTEAEDPAEPPASSDSHDGDRWGSHHHATSSR